MQKFGVELGASYDMINIIDNWSCTQGISPHIILISVWYDSYMIALIKKGHHIRIISHVSYKNHIILIWELCEKGIISESYYCLYNIHMILIWELYKKYMISKLYDYLNWLWYQNHIRIVSHENYMNKICVHIRL